MHQYKHLFKKRALDFLIINSLLVAIGGCGSSGSSSGGDNPTDRGSGNEQFNAITIDASDHQNYRYFNLESGQLVELTAEEAAASTEWHMGFSRYNVILNGGDSGIGHVKGALAATQADFYDDEGEPDSNIFLNASPDSELEHLLAQYDTASLEFVSDEKSSAIQVSGARTGNVLDMGWYNYNLDTHTTSLNDQNWWLLRSANGDSYAKFHATALDNDPVNGLSVTFEFQVQPAGVDQFTSIATFNAQIPAGGGEACFDFDNDETIACNSPHWDLKLEVSHREWKLWTHSGPTANGNGGAFGPMVTAEADQYTSATIAPSGADIRFHYNQDKSAGVFETNPWYAYNLQGGHKLWPNYRVYLIDTDSSNPDSKKYALQIVSYYSDASASGHLNIRYLAH